MSFRILLIEPSHVARIGLESIFHEHGLPVPEIATDREDLKQKLEAAHFDFVVVGSNVYGETAFEFSQSLKATLPDLRFVLWTSVVSHSVIAQAILHGFSEVIPKTLTAKKFVEAMDCIRLQGRMDVSILRRFVEFINRTNWPVVSLDATTVRAAVDAIAQPFLLAAQSEATDNLKKRSGKKVLVPEPISSRSQKLIKAKRNDAPGGEVNVELTKRETQMIAMLTLGLNNQEIGAILGIRLDTTKEHVQNILRKLGLPDRTAVAIWAMKFLKNELGIPDLATIIEH